MDVVAQQLFEALVLKIQSFPSKSRFLQDPETQIWKAILSTVPPLHNPALCGRSISEINQDLAASLDERT